MAKAVILFSGGMDSTFCLYKVLWRSYDEVHCLFFDYGQRHLAAESQSAWKIAQRTDVTFQYIKLDFLRSKGPLTNPDMTMEVFKDYAEAEDRLQGKIEPAFVPMRNAMFLTAAVNYAAVEDARDIYIGITKEDGATVPDCRAEFLQAFTYMAVEAFGYEDKDGVRFVIMAPIYLPNGKVDMIREALEFPKKGCYAAWAFSTTSYFGEYPPRARDHASVCREDAFEKANVPDPLIVRAYCEDKIPYPDHGDVYIEWKDIIQAFRKRLWLLPAPHGQVSWGAMEDFEELVRLNSGAIAV